MSDEQIETRHLRHFLALAQELSFTAAGARLNIVQPALSKSIKQLETLLGATLFERNRHRVTLTEAGLAFRAEASQTLEQLQRATRAARRAAKGETGRLTFGFGTWVGSPVMDNPAEVIREFRAEHPDVEVLMREGELVELLSELLAGDLDVLCSLSDFPATANVRSVTVDQFRASCMVHVSHPMAKKSAFRLADLQGVPLILPASSRGDSFKLDAYQVGRGKQRGASFHARFMHECLLAGVQPLPRYFVDTPGGGFALAGCGMGAFLYHFQGGITPLPGMVHRELTGLSGDLFHPVTLHCRQTEATPVTQAFFEVAQRHALGA